MSAKSDRYTEAVGRRKTATARVRITPAKTASMTVNGMTAEEYFKLPVLVSTVFAPMKSVGTNYAVSAHVRGSGHKSQAEAIRHGLSRAMTEIIPEQRKDLKVKGFLKRDPRAKERKKFGLKAARRAPQWSKR